MAEVKAVVFFVVALLSILIRPGIRAQPTIGSSSEDDSCSQLEEGYESQAVENLQLRSELESERQRIKTLENVSYCQAGEIQRLFFEVEAQRRRQRSQESPPVRATFTNRLGIYSNTRGITRVDDRIYVLGHHPNRITVVEGRNNFHFIQEITLNETRYPYDIVYSNKSKCVYISDISAKCIWVMTTGEHRLTKWLTNVTGPHHLSLTSEGHLLVLRYQQSSQLDIYSLNATFIRRLLLPQDVKDPRHVVQTSAGNFIISHRLNNASYGQWVISQLTNDGHLINRFIPRNQSEILNFPEYLFLDLDNNRLFVTDTSNNRVILFDSNDLTWSQVLLSGIHSPFRLFYDANKTHLFVAQHLANVIVYLIN